MQIVLIIFLQDTFKRLEWQIRKDAKQYFDWKINRCR